MGKVFRTESERTDHDLCPRCGIRNLPATYPGALSRVAEVEICSDCGTIEAIEQWTLGSTVVPAGWPTHDRDLANNPGIVEFLTEMHSRTFQH